MTAERGLKPMKRSVNKTSRAVGAAALALLAATVLVACGPKKDASDEVVATVGGQDLTASQLQIALQKQRGMRPDAGDAAAKMVLDQLIDEQIVADKAVSAK